MPEPACMDACTPQPDAAPAATPSQENGPSDGATAGVPCARCGTSNEAGADRCWKCRSFVVGNAAAVTHGVYRKEPLPTLKQDADELIAGILADKGGLDETTTLMRESIRNAADMKILITCLTNNIAKHGLFTPGGNVRSIFSQYLAAQAQFDRLVQRIGLDRKARRVASPLDFIEGND